jgi:hypothetical protein
MNGISMDNQLSPSNAAETDYEAGLETASFGDETGSHGMDGDDADDRSAGSNGTQLADAETRAVSWLRATVLIALSMATVCVSWTVYSRTATAQRQAFHGAYADAALQVKQAFRIGWEPIEALGVDYTSYAKYSGNAWPQVALPDFVDRASATQQLAHASSVMVAPVVTSENLAAWESFSLENDDWLSESTRQAYFAEQPRATLAQESRLLPGRANIAETVFDFDGPVEGDGPFLPLWQFVPTTTKNLTRWINMDLTSVPRGLGSAVQRAMGTATPVVGTVVNIKSGASNEVPEPVALDLFLQTLLGSQGDYLGEPASSFVYPLVDEKKSVVALLIAMHYWRDTLEQVLQPHTHGLVAVVDNVCGQDQDTQTFTYRIDGPNVTYMGEGDLHDMQFDDWQQKSSLVLTSAHPNMDSASPYCEYSLSLYPSISMKKMFITRAPLIHSAMVLFIFFVAGIVFLAYDVLVEYRQQVVMDHALQSTAIVSSLFPEAVRERLFNEEEAGETGRRMQRRRSSDGGGSYLFEAPKSSIKSFLGDDGGTDGGQEGLGVGPNKPIADLFPHCTVLFADISGFTAWSSLRDPAQVFTLLESIYHSFDQ